MKTFLKFSTLSLLTSLLVACGGDSQEWDASFELNASRLQSLKGAIKSGKITVQGQKDTQNITLNTHFHLQSKSDLSALAEAIKIEIKPSGTQGNLVLKKPDSNDYQLTSDLTLTVPEKLSLELTTENGVIDIQNLKANVKVVASNGKVKATNIVGDVDAESNNGTVTFDKVTGHKHRAHTSNGAIDLKQVNGPLVADTSNGNIKALLAGVNRPDQYTLTTSNGDINVQLPADSSVLVQYTKGVGDVSTNFTHKKEASEILVGKGDATMTLKTGNGKLSVMSY